MSILWVAGAIVIFVASLVMGLAGFGIGLVALAFLPFVMTPADAVVLTTLYAVFFALAILLPLRRDVVPGGVALLLVGTVLGTPAGVWVLATVPAPVLKRLIGLVLLGVVGLEWRRPSVDAASQRPDAWFWGLSTGVVAGVLGGAVGTPGPPVILYAMRQGWSPRTVKANLQMFFVVNQAVILGGYWVAGVLTTSALKTAALYAAPAALGVGAGMTLFSRIDPREFRRVVFGMLFVSGVVLVAGA